jgi:hypothetical protein
VANRAACAQQLGDAEQRLDGVAAQLAASADASARAASVVAAAQREVDLDAAALEVGDESATLPA